MQLLYPGTDYWSERVLLASGMDRGTYPAIVYGPDGTLYAVYNFGLGLPGETIEVGGFSVGPGLSYFGAEQILTASEDATQGIASVTVGAAGTPWVAYGHQPLDSDTVTEVRVLANAPL